MLRHYITTAWRQLTRNKLYTALNLAGLALGISCCLLILLYVQSELSYDAHHSRADRIYRLSAEMNLAGTPDQFAMVSMAVGPALKERYPEVVQYTRFLYSPNPITVKLGDRLFTETLFYPADSQVFEVFDFELVEGDPRTALTQPRTVVLTQSLAKKYFGDSLALGKRLRLNLNDYLVTGVMKDLPETSDFPVNALLPMANLPAATQEVFMQDWGRTIFYTYLLFDRPENAIGFESKANTFSDEVITPFWQANEVEGTIRFGLDNLRDLHFQNGLDYDTPKGNVTYLYIFSLVALFILLIACFNVINLSIAQSARRSVEVGIRKATGASEGQLIRQFLGESMLLTVLALILSFGLALLLLPVFNLIAGKHFTWTDVFQPVMLAGALGVALFTGFSAGAYPAFFLSRLKPAGVLKGQFTLKGRKWLRQALVIVQFSISIGLIIGALVIRAQMKYMQTRDLGFRKDQVMVLEMPVDTASLSRTPQLQAEMLRNPAITKVGGASRGVPGERTSELLMRVEIDGQLKENHFKVCWINDQYLPTLGIPVVVGRNFELSRGTDQQQAFIVNEAFVRQAGWKEALGKRMQWAIGPNNQAEFDGTVVGVVGDFHFESLHNPIEPLVMLYEPRALDRMLVRYDGRQTREVVRTVEAAWQNFNPNKPIQYYFLDEFFNRQYTGEERLGQLFTWFSLLTILIACMGLFGLASFITRQRTKEIGMRKVLGAENRQILALIWRDFAVLVGAAIAIGSILAWVLLSYWLKGFAFATAMPWLAYVLAAVMAMAVALLATSYHALRVALANPVHSLRYE